MGTSLRDRFDVMHLLDRGKFSFFQTHLTERVLRNIAVADALPSSAVLTVGIRGSFILVVPVAVQLLVLRAEASFSKPWTAGVSAGLLWTPWHIITSLSGHNKSPAGEGSHKASVGFTLSIIILS